jgi:hypothetical protein
MGDKCLIFCPARCGSETLVSILNCHPQMLVVSEPFNRDNFEGQYLQRVKDASSLQEALNDLGREYTGIKHVWDASGWPFANLTPDFNRLLLQLPGQRIIFLTRKNSLKRIISLCIAEQTKRWGVFSEKERTAVSGFSFAPISPRFVRWHLEGDKKLLPEYRKVLADSKCLFMELSYEELFDASRTLEERLEVIAQVFKFLDKEDIHDPDVRLRVHGWLETRQTAVDAALLYGRIPNIEDIEKEFGSPETGSLFAAPVPASSG